MKMYNKVSSDTSHEEIRALINNLRDLCRHKPFKI